jgi:hypothetical protein
MTKDCSMSAVLEGPDMNSPNPGEQASSRRLATPGEELLVQVDLDGADVRARDEEADLHGFAVQPRSREKELLGFQAFSICPAEGDRESRESSPIPRRGQEGEGSLVLLLDLPRGRRPRIARIFANPPTRPGRGRFTGPPSR